MNTPEKFRNLGSDMSPLPIIAGFILALVILWDSFETIILPRRVTRKLRIARAFYRITWAPWAAVANRFRPGNRRESFLSFYGPLSMLFLFTTWALGMVLAFGLLLFGLGRPADSPAGRLIFWKDLYFSGTTFFTLGLGDVSAQTWPAKVLTVIEGGIGFGFLALIITYMPVLYEAFSRREVNISMLDARAGSPPTAGELLRRHFSGPRLEELAVYLHHWETWAAQLMESHLSYPVLCFYRSQHSNQSWLAALATILDGCAVLIAYAEMPVRWQAGLTFAMARHAVVDLAQVLHSPPIERDSDRLSPGDLEYLQGLLAGAGIQVQEPARCLDEFGNLRRMYDPYLRGLSMRLLMPLPRWTLQETHADNWRTSAWGRGTTGASIPEEH